MSGWVSMSERNNLNNRKNLSDRGRSQGFTLVEVLFVLFFMMILVYQIAPRFTSAEELTRVKADAANRLRIEGAIELYKLDTGTNPEMIEDLMSEQPDLIGWRGPYLDKALENPIKGAEPYTLDAQGKVRPPQ
jgi:general secretion pathway protein G